MRCLAIALLLLAALPSMAAEPAPPASPLTPEEMAAGWLAIFDGESTFGWKVEGDAEVKDGKLVVGGAKATKLTTTTSFPPGSLRRVHENLDKKPIPGGKIIGPGRLVADLNEILTSNSSTPYVEPFGPNQPHGPIVIEVPAGHQVAFSKLAVKLVGLKPLFNGTDLTGWTLYTGDAGKRKLASKFDVTSKGELHVVDGPGDLQTTGKYADFCLQFDCQTNGKQLNSGIFFRCLPDQYQNGYEAQIQNGYLGERTNPVDFGTGAIYRRVKSRKVVSNDNEWFTMTVLAQGKHIATWVNGYQTVDWTDDRPENENPRQGSKTGAGHLSIQGHDPTTDILFRNLRIIDMKK